jgi:uncharacterized protein (DUF58 family)
MSASAEYLRPEVLSKITRLELRARRVVEGFVSGRHKSSYRGFSVEFAEHREYTPGDDTRHIDWRVFARADRYYIKQYEEETNLRTHLLLDGSKSMAYPEHPGEDRMTKWDYAATVAASLAYLLVHQQDAAGLTLFDRQVRVSMPPASSHAHLDGLVNLIAEHRPGGETNVGAMLHELADEIRHRGLIVLISDLLTDADELIGGLQHLRHGRHELIVFQVLDHDELVFPFRDNTLFEGLEQADLQLLTDPQTLRKTYLEAVGQFTRRLRAACANLLIDYVLLDTHQPLDVALTSYLAMRAGRRKAV